MTIQDLNSFSIDIENLSPIECDEKAIDCLQYIKECGLDVKDYKYLQFYSEFNGLLVTENSIIEEDTTVLNEVTKPVVKKSTSTNKSKRERIVKLVLDCLSIADRTGLNMNKYKKFYEGLSDEEFAKHMNSFTKDEDKNFYLEILPNKSEPPIEDIEKLLSKLKIPKEEYVYYKDDGYKDDPIRSREQCSVGFVNVRRLQQILSKKNTYSLDIESRSSKTGQVTGADKIARISDSELYALTVFKADKAIQEFYGPRADSMISKSDMYGKISKYGYVYLDELATATGKNQTLNTINIYLLGAGINSDLVEKEEKNAKDALTQAVIDAELLKLGGSIRKEDTELNEADVAAAACPEIEGPVLSTPMPVTNGTVIAKSDVARKYFYVAVNDKEKEDGYIDYKLTEQYNGKYVNLTLEGLENYLQENDVPGYTHYTKCLVAEKELLVYSEANDIGILKLPFTRNIENCKILNSKNNNKKGE